MSSTFFGFNIARSGLFTAQRSLDVSSHNIANAETAGYTRQRVDAVQEDPLKYPGTMMGAGVTTEAVKQIRNDFLDIKFRYENMVYGESSFRFDSLSEVEAIMNEPSDSGIRTVMDDFFNSLQELSKDPSSLTARAVVRERAHSLTYTISHMYDQFEKMVKDTDFAVKTTVDEINMYASDIASINDQIFRAELGGVKANDLRDRRNLLIDKLSSLVGVEVVEVSESTGSSAFESKKMNILINGNMLVSHDKVNKLVADEQIDHPAGIADISVRQVKFSTGDPLNVDAISGKLKAELDIRDNASEGARKGVSFYMKKLDEFVKTFAEQINGVHMAGYGLDAATTGIAFFEAESGGDITAKNITLSKKIEEDLDNIAAAGIEDDATVGKGLAGDNSNILEIAELRHKNDMFMWGTPDDFVKSLVANLGVDAQDAKRTMNNQEVLTQQIETQRQSISGVSLDEEMTNVVRFQHAYNASARMITTLDEMIDVIVNRMGRVGL
ncbi:flagellar hook-associated protein 1 [Peptoclostridium acidaminophilum DSM 3953]|uniref:Flagellar hook-associated protein 1 n=1 Tax=Peptoclostridium acidaminophilum DSM 3953 TaxID=1286171 RepID=W8T1M0_PEPAC|nr:flagellar hook-associated protein FlgK [Peptoclostridium acidaminophilum]AHM55619.1 flagellar hook-associated protein 1 [Peptoclostridium acidaminophilum DSM 3953]